MTFVSYAQNFEDVLLWRALGHIDGGFYIDLGAAHPDVDSVTRAFYDRGWSGINVEPMPELYRRLTASRPRDTNLRLAAGEKARTAQFFVVENTGLSTLHGDLVVEYQEQGRRQQAIEVQVETLGEICRRYVQGDIHFLKVDVEGSELAALSGADFRNFRPWIVLVEATAPMSTVELHAEWEPVLVAADYRFAWFDGLNRFYIAAERYHDLSPHFRTPPNCFDDFVRAADTEWARRIGIAEARNAELERQLAEARRGLRTAPQDEGAEEGRSTFAARNDLAAAGDRPPAAQAGGDEPTG